MLEEKKGDLKQKNQKKKGKTVSSILLLSVFAHLLMIKDFKFRSVHLRHAESPVTYTGLSYLALARHCPVVY